MLSCSQWLLSPQPYPRPVLLSPIDQQLCHRAHELCCIYLSSSARSVGTSLAPQNSHLNSSFLCYLRATLFPFSFFRKGMVKGGIPPNFAAKREG